jgi:hypothetical protein
VKLTTSDIAPSAFVVATAAFLAMRGHLNQALALAAGFVSAALVYVIFLLWKGK